MNNKTGYGLRVLDGEHFICALDQEELPEEKRGHILIFYHQSRDAIIISTSRIDDTKLIGEMISEYLSLSDQGRRDFMKYMKQLNNREDDYIIQMITVINTISRIRRRLYRKAS